MRPAIVAAAAFLTAAAIATAVRRGDTRRLDRVLRRLYPRLTRGGAYRAARLTKTIAMPRHQVAVAALVSYTLRRLRIPGANAVGLAGATAMAADAILKVTLPRRRPRVYPGSRIDESFPSGHATTTTAVTLTLADVLERAGIVDAPRATIAAVAVTVFISGSRLLLDEHWPSDVVAGVVLGFAISRSVRADAPATRRGRLTNGKRKTVERIAETTP